jgi:hypothetical protein
MYLGTLKKSAACAVCGLVLCTEIAHATRLDHAPEPELAAERIEMTNTVAVTTSAPLGLRTLGAEVGVGGFLFRKQG